MIRIASRPKSVPAAIPAIPAWHLQFLAMLPAIVNHARIAFRQLNPDARDEAVQEVVCNACAAVARLAELGKLDLAYPSVLARYGVAQVKSGRMTGGHLNCQDVSSRYCKRLKGIVVERLDRFDAEEDQWQEAVVQDTRTASVPEIVSFRCDFSDWLANLARRNRRMAESLAIGNCTSDVAKRFKVSAGRVSQLRRELAQSWKRFVGEEPEGPGVAAV
jgi:hypothetical protein